MSNWTKIDRLQAVLNKEPADRPPVSVWRHFNDSEHSGAQDFACSMIAFQKKYNWDFIKMQPRAVYYAEAWGNVYDFEKYNGLDIALTKKAVGTLEDLDKITEQSGTDGVFKEQLDAIRIIKNNVIETPVFQTIFTPAGILLDLCADSYVSRYHEAPREKSFTLKLINKDKAMVHRALKSIAVTLAKYASAAIGAGADGIFYAALGMARTGYFTQEEWLEFVRPYDLIILEEIKKSITMLHTCGIYSNPEWFTDYPVSIIQWAESATGNPPLGNSSVWLNGKVPMGGVDERLFGQDNGDLIFKKAKEAIANMSDVPFILAPDCSLPQNTYDSELTAFRRSVEMN